MTLGGKDISRGLAASAPLVLMNGRLESHLLSTVERSRKK